MANRVLKDFSKALALASNKFNVKKNEPIESSAAVDDVIECVRRHVRFSMKSGTNDDNDEDTNIA